tara:strand:- start:510 stop:1271 length:762 start_codon:yes stop_codon:yes gene_type:complete
MKIGIVLVATNAYFVMGIKFVKRFYQFYTGSDPVVFYFFSDTDPKPYVPDHIDIKHIKEEHKTWVSATNSKFNNILKLQNEDVDYLFYFDADTNVSSKFDCNWFLGDLVGGEHFGNRGWMKDKKPFDRNPDSKAYIPLDTELPQTYVYGAFFGGKKDRLVDFCSTLSDWQMEDKKIPYEPAWNDESYINKFFHFSSDGDVKIIKTEDFPFQVSDKSGVGDSRDSKLDVEHIKEDLLKYKDLPINICGGKVLPL